MKDRYRLFLRRKSVYYAFDRINKTYASLGTRDKATAAKLIKAKNDVCLQPSMNRQLARIYAMHADSEAPDRTWVDVMQAVLKSKHGSTLERWEAAVKDKAYRSLRKRRLLETTSEDLLKVMEQGGVSTNVFLRRLQCFALDMAWLSAPIVPRKLWPVVRHKEKRAITAEEHRKIVDREHNPEWKAYYQLLWHFGGSQSDVARLRADNIDWSQKTVCYGRSKTGVPARIHFGMSAERVLRSRPSQGLLFPRIAEIHERHRVKQFRKRCNTVGVTGVSMHCYRYAWAERAKTAGYPERFAQAALGHASKAVHRAYARNAQVQVPSLEAYEQRSQAAPAALATD